MHGIVVKPFKFLNHDMEKEYQIAFINARLHSDRRLDWLRNHRSQKKPPASATSALDLPQSPSDIPASPSPADCLVGSPCAG